MARITKGNGKTDEQTIDFSELRKGDIFRFAGTKKVFEVKNVRKHEIDYFPHSNIWGDYRTTKKASKRQVDINFEY